MFRWLRRHAQPMPTRGLELGVKTEPRMFTLRLLPLAASLIYSAGWASAMGGLTLG